MITSSDDCIFLFLGSELFSVDLSSAGSLALFLFGLLASELSSDFFVLDFFVLDSVDSPLLDSFSAFLPFTRSFSFSAVFFPLADFFFLLASVSSSFSSSFFLFFLVFSGFSPPFLTFFTILVTGSFLPLDGSVQAKD